MLAFHAFCYQLRCHVRSFGSRLRMSRKRSLNFMNLYPSRKNIFEIFPLIPHFYIAKLGYAGIYLFFLILAPKHRLWVLVRTASPILICTHNQCLEQNKKKIQIYQLKFFDFYSFRKISLLHGLAFVMCHRRVHLPSC